MKVKISVGVSKKGRNSSLPNTLVLRIQTHRFPRPHLRQDSLDSNKCYTIISSCFGVCTTSNDVLLARIMLSKFYICALKPDVCKNDNFFVLNTGLNQSSRTWLYML